MQQKLVMKAMQLMMGGGTLQEKFMKILPDLLTPENIAGVITNLQATYLEEQAKHPGKKLLLAAEANADGSEIWIDINLRDVATREVSRVRRIGLTQVTATDIMHLINQQ